MSTAAIPHHGQHKPPTCNMEGRKDCNFCGEAIFVEGEYPLGNPVTSSLTWETAAEAEMAMVDAQSRLPGEEGQMHPPQPTATIVCCRVRVPNHPQCMHAQKNYG